MKRKNNDVKKALLTAAFLLMLMAFALPIALAAEGTTVYGAYGNSWGMRSYELYVPPSYQESTSVPLVVVLHGTTQTAADIAAGTQFNELADQEGFLVLYPQQSPLADYTLAWNWFWPENQYRGSGETSIIAGMTNSIKSQYSVDANRVYVTGMSAGGAMASIMAASYPDIYAAVGVHSGYEWQAAISLSQVSWVSMYGGPNPNLQGYYAYLNAGSAARVIPTIAFHGSSDITVWPINGSQVIKQFAQTNDYADDGINNNSIDAIADQTITGEVPGGYSYTRYIYYDGGGSPLMEKWIVSGMGHAWSGGSPSGSYTDPLGPDATAEMWRFFEEHPKS